MTFKLARNCFVVVAGVIGLLHLLFGVSLAWLLLPGVIFLASIVYGSSVIQANFFAAAYCHADTEAKEIALSFDDGPNRQYTPQALSVLAQYKAPATFFVAGKNIQGNEDLLKEMDANGHIIGNHTYTHSFFIDFKSAQGFKDELNRTAEAVFKVVGKRMKLFRPPYGVTTPHLAKASDALNYHIIGWSIRSFDTTADSADKINQRVQKQIKPGAIILFHDTSEKTIQVLTQTLKFAKENGYKIVSLELLLNIKAYD